METIQIVIFIIIFIEAVAAIFLGIKLFSLSKKIEDLFGKEKGSSIEKVLDNYVLRVKGYHNDIEELKNFSHSLYEMAEKSIQKVGFVRFNPFDDVGGDQSFSVALLDLKNDGVVFTSLFGREGTRVYSKLVEVGISKSHLADEEKKAIEEAIKNYKEGV